MDKINKKVNVNMDFLKHMMSPIKIPAIKSRKIFNAKSSSNEVHQPQELPISNIIDRSPAKISTISSLVEGAPNYDFGLENFPYTDYKDKTNSSTQLHDNDKKNMKLSDKLTKQCKELSEFKFKQILNRKTIVRKTEINVDAYRKRYDEERQERMSENSDYEFEFHSLPIGKSASVDSIENFSAKAVEAVSIKKRRNYSVEFDEISNIESTTRFQIPTRAESLQVITNIEPNNSSLWRRRAIKRKSFLPNDNPVVSRKESTNSQKIQKSKCENIEAKWTSHKQAFDTACEKAKKKVNSKWNKLKLLHSTTSELQSLRKTKSNSLRNRSNDDLNDSNRITKKVINSMIPRISNFNDFNSAREFENSERKSNNFKELESYSSSNWISEKFSKCSLDMETETQSHSINQGNSLNAIQKTNVKINRRAPPIPKRINPPLSPPPPPIELSARGSPSSLSSDDSSIQPLELFSNSNIILAIPKVTPPSEKRTITNIVFDSTKGHNRKPSMDSLDSDSWIPENYRESSASMSRNQIILGSGLNKIHENSEPWQHLYFEKSYSVNSKKLQKDKSVDIFLNEDDNVFENFDDFLKNEPIFEIKTNEMKMNAETSLENCLIESCRIKSKSISFPSRILPKESSSNVASMSTSMVTFDSVDNRKPIVKQSSITRQFSDEMLPEEKNINVNKLISRFEKPSFKKSNENSKNDIIMEDEFNAFEIIDEENFIENVNKLNSINNHEFLKTDTLENAITSDESLSSIAIISPITKETTKNISKINLLDVQREREFEVFGIVDDNIMSNENVKDSKNVQSRKCVASRNNHNIALNSTTKSDDIERPLDIVENSLINSKENCIKSKPIDEMIMKSKKDNQKMLKIDSGNEAIGLTTASSTSLSGLFEMENVQEDFSLRQNIQDPNSNMKNDTEIMTNNKKKDPDISDVDIRTLQDWRIKAKNWVKISALSKEKRQTKDSDDEVFYSFDKDDHEILEDADNFDQKIIRQYYCINL